MKTFKILLALMLCAASAYAQKVSVTAQAPGQVVEGRNFTVSLSVTNGQPETAPSAPQIARCKHIYGPVKNTMQSYQNINGQVTSSTQITFTFTYKAEKAGTTTVPAMSVIVDGKSYSTDQLRVEVLPPDQSSAGGRQGGRQSTAPSVDDEVQFDPNDMFIRVILDKSTVYEQQAVTATVKIYSKYDITSFRSIAQPTFNDFFSEEIPLSSNGRTEHYNGKNYFTAELRKIVLYPQKSGRLEITSGQFELTVVLQQPVRVGPWIDYRPIEKPVTAKTNSATVTVLPLPAPRPANFRGAVGNYTATAEMSPLSLRANELATYTYKIEG
ncbi:MAG: BatD family protein, partial [Muribaculaceae bacterium]|nr:BatD family protein [Muribaculaceae bacterium]